MSSLAQIRSYEQRHLTMIRQEIERSAGFLSRRGYRASEPVVRIESPEERSYTSEVSLTIYDESDNIVDLIEYFVYRQGKDSTAINEARRWIRTELRRLSSVV